MSERTEKERIPELDGLRGVAILLVILLHYVSDSTGGGFGSVLYRFRAIFRLGWCGVDLFFVLSGFLIGGILLDARDSPRYFQTFYVRRAYRILPIYYVWVTLYIVVNTSFEHWRDSPLSVDPAILNHLPLYYLFAQTFQPLLVGTVGAYWMGVTWSVAIEEQFYLIAAPMVRFLREPHFVCALVSTIFLCPFLRLLVIAEWPSQLNLIYVFMPCRADSLAIGMITAVLWKDPGHRRWLANHSKQLSAAALSLLAGIPVFIKWFPSPYTRFAALVEYQWLAFMFACLLLISLLDKQSVMARAMRLGFLGHIGQLSYCIYLIHLPILAIAHAVLLGSPVHRIDTFSGIGVTILAAGITFTAASLSWAFLESPLIRRGHQYKY
jgi:peptidoglycan/LPS O-acetylase OafA/YrhL